VTQPNTTPTTRSSRRGDDGRGHRAALRILCWKAVRVLHATAGALVLAALVLAFTGPVPAAIGCIIGGLALEVVLDYVGGDR
jgi:hypothetical protein